MKSNHITLTTLFQRVLCRAEKNHASLACSRHTSLTAEQVLTNAKTLVQQAQAEAAKAIFENGGYIGGDAVFNTKPFIRAAKKQLGVKFVTNTMVAATATKLSQMPKGVKDAFVADFTLEVAKWVANFLEKARPHKFSKEFLFEAVKAADLLPDAN